jgi:hypothetical protein
MIRETRLSKVIRQLDKLKENYPDQMIIVETPNGCIEFKIGEALIYINPRGTLVIDSE